MFRKAFAFVNLITILSLFISTSAFAQNGQTPSSPVANQAPTIALGQPGLSFRYMETFGTTEVPYSPDSEHLNRPYNGNHWTQINTNGFSESYYIETRYGKPTMVFNNNLFFGTQDWGSTNGVKIWQLMNPVYLPLVMKSFPPPAQSHWINVTSPVTTTLYSMSMVSSSEGWAVGDSGVILHWNGSNWSAQNSGTQVGFRAVSMVSSTNGWAGGLNNTLLHYDGTLWSPATLTNNSTIWSISMLSATDGWLVGQDSSSFQPVVYRWNGSLWVKQTEKPSQPLARIAPINSNNVWGAIGALYCNPNCDDFVGSYSHWNGASWTNTSLTHRGIWGLAMSDANNGWMTGIQKDVSTSSFHSLIMRWNGSSWSDVSHPDSFLLNGVATNSPGFAMTVGYGGKILIWNGTDWSNMSSPTSNALRDITLLSTTEAWAVGDQGTILHYAP